ncbi:MAG TPA: hypothetical protein VHG70_06210 [Nocardioidaceae bacterium]|nr:hypothetical protein [Nocardioidaceae bacterium]
MDRIQILMVCTANVCRSPLAERLLLAHLRTHGRDVAEQFHVVSAGLTAMAGHPMHPFSERELIALGGDSSGFQARQLGVDMVQQADLILTATRRQKSLLLTDHAWAHPRAFTLRDFDAAMQYGPDVSSVEDLIAVAARSRGLLRLREPDIRDPIEGGRAAHRAAARTIDSCARNISRTLTGLVRVVS